MSTHHPSLFRRLGLLGASSLLSACALLNPPPVPPMQSFAWDSETTADAGLQTQPQRLPVASAPPPSSDTARPPTAGQRVILVSAPTAAPGYDSSRMVYTRDAGSLEAFTHSMWVDTPARMLEPLVARALQDSGTFRAVVAAPSSTRADLRLDCSIERLQQNYLQHPSQARLQLRVTLLDNNSREVLAWQVFDMSQAATTEDAAGAAAATRAVVQKATQALALWLKDY